jgi:hypothetical protein
VTTQNEGGFEYDGRFYEWRFGTTGKDLMLLDRICGMSLSDLFEAVDQGRDRPSLMLAMIALALRAGNPSWSVERIVHIVEEIDTETDIKLLGLEEPPGPPAETTAEQPTGEPLRSPSNGSSLPSTPVDGSSFETSFAAPV